MSAKTWTAEQREAMDSVIAITRRNIDELESALASSLNAGRYVILMDSSVIAACQRLKAGGFNFAAMGVEAATWTEREAERYAASFRTETGRTMRVSPVFVYYTNALTSAKESLAFYLETLGEAG
jgi:hypothetical protein